MKVLWGVALIAQAVMLVSVLTGFPDQAAIEIFLYLLVPFVFIIATYKYFK